jgi:hypothetical protein
MNFMLLKRKECGSLCAREDENPISGILFCRDCELIRIDHDGAPRAA